MKNVFRFLLLMCSFHAPIFSLHAQWNQTSGPLQASVNELLYSGTNLFAGTNRGVYRSTDDGATWTQVNNGLAGDTMIVALAVSGTNLFAGDWVNGVFRSTDDGANWTDVNNGIGDTFISDLLVSGTIIFAGTADGGGIYRTVNNGESWAVIDDGLGGHDGIVLALSGTDVLLGDDDCKIFRYNGTSWVQISAGITGTNISSLVVSGSNLFAGTGSGVFLSTDNGTNWTQVNSGLTDASVNTLILSGMDLFAGTTGGVFHSADDGASWIQLNGGLTDTNITALTSSGTHLFAGTDTSGVYRGLLSALPVELTTFAATARQNGVELHWRTATEVNNYGFEIQKSEVRDQKFDVSSQYLESNNPEIHQSKWGKAGFVEGSGSSNSPKEYSFTDKNLSSGKYSYRLKQIDNDGKFEYSQEVEVMIAQMPQMFSLMQNYPNPFNPTTTIGFTIPALSPNPSPNGRGDGVTLKVYDVIGREVATLVDEVKEAGNYDVKFVASKLSSGMYFYTLKAGNNIQTKKLMLLK